MMKKLLLILPFFILILSCTSQEEINKNDCSKEKTSLVILWTSGDPEVFNKVVFPYGLNAKKQGLWDEVELLIWGPSTKLLFENENMQRTVTTMKENGVILTSCLWCADQYGATEKLKSLGIDVKYMGKPLTEYLQSDKKVITF